MSSMCIISPLAIRLVKAVVIVSVIRSTDLSIFWLFLTSFCAKKAFLIALAILSDLKGVIEPSRLTTLRLNKFISSFCLFTTVFFVELSSVSALFVSILPTNLLCLTAKNTRSSVLRLTTIQSIDKPSQLIFIKFLKVNKFKWNLVIQFTSNLEIYTGFHKFFHTHEYVSKTLNSHYF